jgi:hypothetical protein
MSCSRIPTPWPETRSAALGLLATPILALGLMGNAQAAPDPVKTVCAITINSADEKVAFERHLPRDRYRIVELVERGRPDWFDAACRSGLRCDALIISGHFDDGSEFYADQSDFRDHLTVAQLQQATCSASCGGLFDQLQEVYLFGCKTLGGEPRHTASAEVRRSLVRAGRTPEEAERVAAQLNERYGQSNRDRIRHIFKDVPVIYGFSAQAPLGRFAGPLVERYFQTAPAGEVASGRPSPTLLSLFAPVSMVSAAGLTQSDANAAVRRDLCGLADARAGLAGQIAFAHQLLRRDPTEVRMLLDHLETLFSRIGPTQRVRPDVDAALAAISADALTRHAYLAFARDADEARVHSRMMALAQRLGWLSAEQERDEFARMLALRMQRGSLGKHDVDHVCASRTEPDLPLVRQLLDGGSPQPGQLAHTAALACLGDPAAQERTVRALVHPGREGDAEIAEVYLRHRPLRDVAQLRQLTAGLAKLPSGPAQLRALGSLARQRLADAPSLETIAGLFPQARSLEVQRAIAGILIRADYRLLPQAELARSLRQHRLRSPDGGDVIDVLIRLLQAG